MSKPTTMDIKIQNDVIELQRTQWRGNTAYISNYPGLLDEVKKYTWTYSDNGHPYLNCSKLKTSLHKFVLQFLYGKDKLDIMLGNDNIIEHLDNNGLNCCYENLHILSSKLNKAKAFSIDEESDRIKNGEYGFIPALITDVYYSHAKRYFQLQLYFNTITIADGNSGQLVNGFNLRYNDFNTLFIDWLYCYECIKKQQFDFSKIHTDDFDVQYVPKTQLREDEKEATFIERDGKILFVIRTDESNDGSICFVSHTPFRK